VCAVAVCLLQKVKLTGWMLVMSKLAEIQMESALSAADELEEKPAHVEKLTQQVEKLKQKNKKLSDTIDQQQSVIQGIHGLLQQSGHKRRVDCNKCNGDLNLLTADCMFQQRLGATGALHLGSN